MISVTLSARKSCAGWNEASISGLQAPPDLARARTTTLRSMLIGEPYATAFGAVAPPTARGSEPSSVNKIVPFLLVWLRFNAKPGGVSPPSCEKRGAPTDVSHNPSA